MVEEGRMEAEAGAAAAAVAVGEEESEELVENPGIGR